MSDTTTITAEERDFIRNHLEDLPFVDDGPLRVVRLLNALEQAETRLNDCGDDLKRAAALAEQAEARVHELEGSLSSSISKQSKMADGIERVVKANHALAAKAQEAEARAEQTEARAEKAEANVVRLTKMVDWLAGKLIDCPPEFTNCAVDCAECRKEAARRAVAAGEE